MGEAVLQINLLSGFFLFYGYSLVGGRMKELLKKYGFKEFMIPQVTLALVMYILFLIMGISKIITSDESIIIVAMQLSYIVLLGVLAFYGLKVFQFMAVKLGAEKTYERMTKRNR